MPRLDFYVNFTHQASIMLEEKELLIGRDMKCALRIPNKKVSRVHAIIRASGEGHEIENHGANGTKVNGRLIEEPCSLQAGDTIFIGRCIVIYQPDDAPVVDDASTVLDTP